MSYISAQMVVNTVNTISDSVHFPDNALRRSGRNERVLSYQTGFGKDDGAYASPANFPTEAFAPSCQQICLKYFPTSMRNDVSGYFKNGTVPMPFCASSRKFQPTSSSEGLADSSFAIPAEGIQCDAASKKNCEQESALDEAFPEGTFEGYASVFQAVDQQGDALAPGAFQASLEAWKAEGHLPKLLWQHDPRTPIGVWDFMEEDDYGLFVRGHLLLDLPKAREAYVLLKTGVVDGLSIGFLPRQVHEEGGVRVLDQVDLFEVSLVTFMANPLAYVTTCKGGQSQTSEPRGFRAASQNSAREGEELSPWKPLRRIIRPGATQTSLRANSDKTACNLYERKAFPIPQALSNSERPVSHAESESAPVANPPHLKLVVGGAESAPNPTPRLEEDWTAAYRSTILFENRLRRLRRAMARVDRETEFILRGV